MASQCMRAGVGVLRRSISTTARLTDKAMHDPMEHATGIEKRELLAHAAGNTNPFDMRMVKRVDATTVETATEIPSAFDSRIIGCICNEDSVFVKWMWLHKGTPKRCGCGFWFKIVEKAPV